MVDKIKMIKDCFLKYMEKDSTERGVERIDIGDYSKMADIVKDLAEAEKSCWEAEYYRSISASMEADQHSYGISRSQGGNARRGYNESGYHKEIDGIREMLNRSTPEEREKIQRELRHMVSM